jgi:putative transcriptional regulator
MSKIATTGKRTLKGDVWHDANGIIAGTPADWVPPMSDDEITAAALADPDCQPLSADRLADMRRISFAQQVRRKVGLSQAAFAERYRIPIGTLRDWEQNRAQPDAAAIAYLTVIAAHPEMTAAALAA